MKTRNSRNSGLIAVLALGLSTSAFAQTPILEYKFDDTGTTSTNSGSHGGSLTLRDAALTPTDLHGTAGSGVSGAVGDRAFNNTASTSGSTGGGGLIGDIDGSTAGTWLTSFTAQGWFQTSALITDTARLFDKNTGGTSSLAVRFAGVAGGNQLAVSVNGSGLFSAANATYASTNSWVFFAVTYDGSVTSNNVKFYVGTTSSGVTQVGATGTLNNGGVANNGTAMVLGNTSSVAGTTVNRPFDGLLDNMRLYGAASGASGVLTLAQLETLRVADVTSVPEPSTVATLIGSAALLSAFVYRRRRNA
jgi:hypothetical protein